MDFLNIEGKLVPITIFISIKINLRKKRGRITHLYMGDANIIKKLTLKYYKFDFFDILYIAICNIRTLVMY